MLNFRKTKLNKKSVGFRQILSIIWLMLQFTAVIGYNPKEYCGEFVCTKAGSYMKHAIKRGQDPCQDFYRFACGVADARLNMPETVPAYDRFDVLNSDETSQIRMLLERSNNVVKSIHFAREVYQQCIRYGKSKDSGLSLLKDSLESVNGGWHIGQQHAKNSSTKPWYNTFVQTVTSGSISPLFGISVIPNPKNDTTNIISFDFPKSRIGDHDLKENSTEISNTIDAYRTFIEKSAKLFGGNNLTLLKLQIDEIVQLESNLANIELSAEDRRNPEKMYHKIEVKEFSEKCQFDWLSKVLKPILAKLEADSSLSVTNNTEVVVTDLNYYVKAIQIINKLQPETVENYFGWKLVEFYSKLPNKELKQFSFEFDHVKRDDGVKKPPNFESTCLDLVEQTIPLALTRLYIQIHFENFEMKEAKKLIPEEIRNSLINYTMESEWLDDDTKVRTLEKLQKLRFDIAYPVWLMDNNKLDQYHGFNSDGKFLETLLEEKNILQMLSKFRTNMMGLDFKKVFKPLDFVSNLDIPPRSHKVVYQPEINTLTIPAGMLKFPFFSKDFPASINLASIGMLVAHEIVHAIDDRGRYFDSDGNLHQWWNNHTLKQFRNHSDCLVEQYGSILDKKVDMKLDGALTLSENFADNIALQQSFRAYKDYDARHNISLRLVLVPNYVSDQIFFITYAQVWCGLMRPEMERYQLKHYGYSPNQFRVNVPLSNFPEFSEAFNCTAGTPMNPVKKCPI